MTGGAAGFLKSGPTAQPPIGRQAKAAVKDRARDKARMSNIAFVTGVVVIRVSRCLVKSLGR